ncbi:MAG: hypothetical protein NVS2B16_12290 [Chloroflexota bacterium]
MSVGDIIQHLYLPLLTQETAVMVSAFTYSLKAGAGTPLLVVVNTIAVVTDLLIFFVPIHFLSQRLHDRLIARFQERYDTGMSLVSRFGAFRTATVVAFVMPSVAAMIVVGLLRLSFWRALAGLFAGSAAYVVLPLLIALPLASRLPRFIVPVLPWMSPVLALAIVIVALFRLWNGRREPLREGT